MYIRMLSHPAGEELSAMGFDPGRQALARELRLLKTVLSLARYGLLFLTAFLLGAVSDEILGIFTSAIRPRWLGILVYGYAIAAVVHWPLLLAVYVYSRKLRSLGLRVNESFPKALGWYLGHMLLIIPALAATFGISLEPWHRTAWPPAFYVLFDMWAGVPLRILKGRRAEGELRERAVGIAGKLGIKAKHVKLKVVEGEDPGAGFFVSGFGHFAFLTTGLLEVLSPRERDAVVAHELTHQKLALPMFIFTIGPRFFLPTVTVGFLLKRLAPLYGIGRFDIAALPLFLALAEFGLFLSHRVENPFRRWLERRADAIALRATGDPAAFARATVALYDHNLVDAAPGRLWQFLFGTIPAAWIA
ncbi:M48 family metallopeptidase [Candidatus Bipolaricaulota sp. J31]